MPKGDKTGPHGLGSKTGRVAGYCAGYPVPGYLNPTIGYGRGFGRGFGRRRGRGFFRGRFAYPKHVIVQPTYQPVAQPLTSEQEIVILKNYQKELETEKVDLDQEIGSVKTRIEELKTTTKKEK
jgi:hypothetical protein